MKKIHHFTLSLFLCICFLFGILITLYNDTIIFDSETPLSEFTPTSNELTVHFIDVGQGDSILIQCDGYNMLIDAGDNSCGTRVQSYLMKSGVTSLDYCISTHSDADHCGGLDVILYKFDCTQVFLSNYEKDSATYRDVLNVINSKGIKASTPEVGSVYSLGSAVFTIVGPTRLASDANNNSIAILLQYGDNKFLFTGDAEEQEELDMINSGIPIACDVYKAGHHGSRTSSSLAFLQSVTPKYCVISCGEQNSYGHPHAELLNNLRGMGVQVFRTDEQGSIIVTSNGHELTWNCSPSTSWLSGEPTGSSLSNENDNDNVSAVVNSKDITFVCNTNTKKFHLPSCDSVLQISQKNRLDVTFSYEEIMKQGYSPCKRCLDK